MAGGRPSSYSQVIADKIAHEVEMNRTFASACRAAGIHPSTGHRWQKEIPEFCEILKRARGDRLHRLMGLMEEAATSDPKCWKAAHELILLLHPKLNPRIRQRVQEEADALMQRVKEQASPAAYEELRHIILNAKEQPTSPGAPSGPKLRAV
jgi:hypothetical protein